MCVEDLKKFVLEDFGVHANLIDTIRNDPKLIAEIVSSAELIVSSLKSGGKIMAAGNGGSSCQADHLAEELVARFHKTRPALPALSLTNPGVLTCIGNDFGFEDVFSRQLEALGNKGDIFYGLTTSGNSPNIIKAVEMAHKKGMKTIILTGSDGGKLKFMQDKIDNLILIPGKGSDRIQEVHISIIHIHCELIERMIFPELYR